MSRGSVDDGAMRQVASDVARWVARTYAASSPAELAGLYRATYAPQAAFIDPFVKAAPSREARLQFLALQRYPTRLAAAAAASRAPRPASLVATAPSPPNLTSHP
jgi:hypothetical protein